MLKIKLFSMSDGSNSRVNLKQIIARNLIFFYLPIILCLLIGKIIGLSFWDFYQDNNFQPKSGQCFLGSENVVHPLL